MEVSSLGLGAWSWGDRSRYWQNELDKPSNRTVGSAGLRAPRVERRRPPRCLRLPCSEGSCCTAPSRACCRLLQAYKAMIDAGIDFLDTAEVCVRAEGDVGAGS